MTKRIDVAVEIAADPGRVFSLIADLPRMGQWSPECDAVTWAKGATGPTVGARFTGTNHHGSKSWSTAGRVTECREPSRFAFLITASGLRVAEWCYVVEPTPQGCRVTESWIDKRGALVRAMGKPLTGVGDRASHNRATMLATLEALRAAAEAPAV